MIADAWHIELLGRCRTTRGKEYIDRFRTQKTGALLAYLALYSARRTVTREELASLFWTEDDPAQAGHSLRQTLSWLRTRLEPADTPPGSVLWAPPRAGIVLLQPGAFSTDVSRFESLLRDAAKPGLAPAVRGALLRDALAAYRGDLLPGVYDDWAQTERERLIALRDRAEHQLLGDPAHAAPAANSVSASFPPEWGGNASVPAPINRFWGRDAEIEHLSERLRAGRERLVTVTAPGGFGKTRLAVEVARVVAPSLPGGVVWVSLADLPASARLSDVLETALNLPPVAGKGDGLTRVATAFNRRGGRMLLVVDNAETLLVGGETGVAAQIARLLELAAETACLVTSRVPLAVAGEIEMALAPLPVETERGSSPAVSLLTDRAQAIRRDFALTERNRRSLYALCERLGGIPLALELAAARLRTVSLETLLNEIAAAPDLWEQLGEERRGRPERHRRLRVALESSFAALSPSARRMVAALTIFQNGWTADAAAAVIGGDADSSLCEVASFAWIVSDGGARWHLPLPLKEFAAEHLAPGNREPLLSRHAAYFAAFARTAFESRHTAAQIDCLGELSADRENLRLALATLTQTAPGDALRLAGHLSWFWRRRGDWDASRRQLRTLLDHHGTANVGDAIRSEALIGLGDLCWSLGRPDDAEAAFREARSLAFSDSVAGAVRARTEERLGRFLIDNGRWRDGEPSLRAAYRWYTEIGDRRGAGKCLGGIALAAHYAENYPTARKLVGDARREMASVGDRLEQTALIHQSGWCGAPEESDAERMFRCESLLALADETGDTLTRATALLELGEAYRLAGNLPMSHTRLTEGKAVARSIGAVLQESLICNQEGVTLRLLGRLTEAEVAHRDALTLALQISQNAFGPRVRIVLADFAVLLRVRKQVPAAARIHGAIAAWSERNGLPIAPVAQSLYRSEQAELKALLGEEAFARAWREGADANTVDELF